MCGLDITFVKSILYKIIVTKFFWDYCLNSRVVLVKGCISRILQMDPVWSLLLLLRPWMGYDYTVI